MGADFSEGCALASVQECKSWGLSFRAVLTEEGTERLELARVCSTAFSMSSSVVPSTENLATTVPSSLRNTMKPGPLTSPYGGWVGLTSSRLRSSLRVGHARASHPRTFFLCCPCPWN